MGDDSPGTGEAASRQFFNVNRDQLQLGKQNKTKVADEWSSLFNIGDQEADLRIQAKLAEEQQSHFVLALLEAAYVFGLRLKNPLRVLEWQELLFDEPGDHRCHKTSCELFHIPNQIAYWDPYTDQSKLSSGLVYVCRLTGKIHLCGNYCTTVVSDDDTEPSFFICAISTRRIGHIFDEMPQGKGVRLARSTIDRFDAVRRDKNSSFRDSGPERGHNNNNKGGGSDSDSENEKDYVDNEPVKALTDKEKVDERKKLKRRGRRSAASKAAGLGAEVEVSDEEESSDNDDEWLHEMQKITDRIDKDQALPAAVVDPITAEPILLDIPPGSGDLVRRTAATTPRAGSNVGVVTTFPLDTPSDPDERTAHFLRNPEQRRVEVDRLLTVLLSYSGHITLWDHLAQLESDRAHAQFEAYVRRQGGRSISHADRYAHWLAHMATYCTPLPKKQSALDMTIYRSLVLKAWWIVARSPYTRLVERTRIVPNLTNICLGLLYTMVDGPLNFDCSLGEQDLPFIPPMLERMQLRKFFVEILPTGTKNLSRFLLAKELLKDMASITMKRYKLSVPKKAKGIRCFRDALTSTVEHYRDELRTALRTSRLEITELVLEYVVKCKNLRCIVPIEQSIMLVEQSNT